MSRRRCARAARDARATPRTVGRSDESAQARLPADAAGADPCAVHLGLSAADAALYLADRLVAARRRGLVDALWECWNTFANYTDLAADNRFWDALGRTALVMLVCVPVEFLLGLALALLFMDDFRGKRVFYSILLMPMMVVPAVAGYMFFMLFQSGGPVNDIISTLTGTTFSSPGFPAPTRR